MRTRPAASPSSMIVLAALLLASLLTAPPALADSTLSGNCWIPKVKGGSDGFLELYEWNVYMIRDGNGNEGKQYRVGGGGPPFSYYTFTFPGGVYSMMLDQPLFWGRPTVVSNVIMPAGGSVNRNIELPTDYSVAFGNNSGPWGFEPWTAWSNVWYQTFVATGTAITGIDFKLAGANAANVQVTIHQSNGGNVTTWPQVGITRVRTGVGALADQWLRYRSGEIPTTPGTTYALKLTGLGGAPPSDFAVFRRIDGGTGYALGQAYNQAGSGQTFDLYAIVMSDNDGTVIPYTSVINDGGALTDWAFSWQQKVRAIGSGLAGVVIYSAGADWDVPLRFRARTGSPTGTQIGPMKVGRGAFQSGGASMAAASWNPGEIILTPGQDYFIEVTGHPEGGSLGLNPSHFTRAENAYPFGDAYKDGVLQPGVDLHMQVVEYQDVTPPTIDRNPASFVRSVPRGDNLPDDTFTIANSGGSTLAYSISDNANWLSVTPDSGYATTETDDLTVDYSVASLAMGDYNATITIDAPAATNTPRTITVTLTVTAPLFARPDLDEDGDVDLVDYGMFQRCYSGPGLEPAPGCDAADFDGDDDVDPDDFGIYQACVTGADVPADTLCAD